ncbi:hypothetical protein EDD86DRAFT_217558 [Gorgonomyces haynaldii]|nr:hypothetical protein EDD86DRAFT_217558 [Gorgonomyces haynaldii]
MGTTEEGYSILLDGRPLKTPSGGQVIVPRKNQVLALLTCAEWEGQDKILKSYTLPVTSIVVRAIESMADQDIRKGVYDNLLKYVNTDAILYHQDYPESFVALQNKHWMPLIEWANKKYDIQLKITNGIVSVKQDERVFDIFRAKMASFDNVELAAFEKIVLRSKSFLIALGLMEDHLTVDQAADCARLEVMHQIEKWGEVEDAHDVDREELRKQLGAARCALIR